MEFVSMNIAVVGTGSVVENYAKRYALAGHQVYMAWKEGDTTEVSPCLYTLDNIHMCSIEEAAEISDLIVIAGQPKDVRELSYWLGDVRRKVIIDATANVHTPADEEVKTVCAIKAITGSDHIVKVFSTRGYEKMLKPLFKDEEIRLVMVGSSRKAKEIAKIFARDLNVTHFFDMGADEAVPLFNCLTRCWKNMLINDQVNTHPALVVTKS